MLSSDRCSIPWLFCQAILLYMLIFAGIVARKIITLRYRVTSLRCNALLLCVVKCGNTYDTLLYICIYIYNFCVEVFEKTISRTDIIDHSFKS